VIPDTVNTEIVSRRDEDKLYELAGSGGRHYYSYTIDSVNKVLILKNRNRHYAGETLVLQYSRPGEHTILLSGLNENKDSVKVTLDKIDKKYLFPLGRSKPIKL
jgi:hypothetical protein